MKNYDVYFEIFDKKMKTTILAETTKDAKQKIIDRIKFHKVVENEDDPLNFLKNIFNINT